MIVIVTVVIVIVVIAGAHEQKERATVNRALVPAVYN